MSRNIVYFEAPCVTPDCPGCGKGLQQPQYTAEQIRGLLEADEPILAFCAYGFHEWAVDQQLREALRASSSN
jgi:hypothetical protein